VFGAPLGISFFGTAFSEPTLIKVASGFEAATQVRAHNPPTFADTVPDRHIQGTNIHPPSGENVITPVRPEDTKKKPHHL